MDYVQVTVYYDEREKTQSRRWKLSIYNHPNILVKSLGAKDFEEAMSIAKDAIKVRAQWKEGLNQINNQPYARTQVREVTWEKHHGRS